MEKRLIHPDYLEKMGIVYTFQIITKDGNKVDAYGLDPVLLGVIDYPFPSYDLTSFIYGRTTILEAASAQVQEYIANLKERVEKNPSEKLKKQLELLENAAAIVVKKRPYDIRKTRVGIDFLRGHRNAKARELGIIID